MRLIKADEKYLQSYKDAIRESELNNVDTYAFLDASKPDFLEYLENLRLGRKLPEGYVPATYLWLVSEDEFLGEIAVRHSLTEALLRRGGHIGYWVSYSHWNKGLGTIMLSKALAYAKEELGLTRALITCNDDNLGSARVIEKNGGKLENKLPNIVDGKEVLTRRYWIDIL